MSKKNYWDCVVRKAQMKRRVWSVEKYGCSGSTNIANCELCQYFRGKEGV